jgi:FAD/FMN-containing dehydrogenase
MKLSKNVVKIYGSDASLLEGRALDVVHPRNVAEVRGIVANAQRVVIRGGGTGLAGGCVPQNGSDVVLDLSKMDEVYGFDKERRTIEVEAGVILDELQGYLARFGLEFPVKPSSHSVATIGGMIATDAVGARAIKYGRTSNWVKWVDVVDGNGELCRRGITELSDYAGMEGISGVIVRACLKLSPLRERSATLVKVGSLEEVVSIVRSLKRDSSVSMIEFLGKKISVGLDLDEGYHLIVEYEDGSGVLSGKKYDDLMEMRDRVYPWVAGEGYIRIEDPKIMIDRFVKLMSWLEEKGIPVFGHIGVGILHPCFNKEQDKFVPEMMKLVKRLGGSISGEHGIGMLKRGFVEANDRKILINVKKRTDPLGKFNMGKVV